MNDRMKVWLLRFFASSFARSVRVFKISGTVDQVKGALLINWTGPVGQGSPCVLKAFHAIGDLGRLTKGL